MKTAQNASLELENHSDSPASNRGMSPRGDEAVPFQDSSFEGGSGIAVSLIHEIRPR